MMEKSLDEKVAALRGGKAVRLQKKQSRVSDFIAQSSTVTNEMK